MANVMNFVAENWYWFVLGFSPFIIWGLIVTILGGLIPGFAEGWHADALWKPKNFYKYAVRQEGCREGWWWILGNKLMRAFNFFIAWLFYIPTCLAYGLGIILRWSWVGIKAFFGWLWSLIRNAWNAL